MHCIADCLHHGRSYSSGPWSSSSNSCKCHISSTNTVCERHISSPDNVRESCVSASDYVCKPHNGSPDNVRESNSSLPNNVRPRYSSSINNKHSSLATTCPEPLSGNEELRLITVSYPAFPLHCIRSYLYIASNKYFQISLFDEEFAPKKF